MARLERLCGTSVCRTLPADLRSASRAARCTRVQNRIAHGCAGAVKHREVRERPPGDFVELGVLIWTPHDHPQKNPALRGLFVDGAPGEIRTPDRSVRSRVLYPAELQALNLETRFYG
jgi:hypothetical protein